MLHAMALLSRPPLVDRANVPMQIDALRAALPRVSRDAPRLRPIIEIAEKFATFAPIEPGYYGGLHHRAAQVMNAWDARRLADGCEALRAGP
ncbi:hypothetical protein [Paracoccus laeviglucosivorans]|nr:hypothetical protein [Paracoccus laeviglucosivorans]